MGAPRDPGLQGERTGLAWLRTGIAMLAVCLLSLLAGLSDANLFRIVAAIVAAAMAGLMLVHAQTRTGSDYPDTDPAGSNRPMALGVALAVVAIAGLHVLGLLYRGHF